MSRTPAASLYPSEFDMLPKLYTFIRSLPINVIPQENIGKRHFITNAKVFISYTTISKAIIAWCTRPTFHDSLTHEFPARGGRRAIVTDDFASVTANEFSSHVALSHSLSTIERSKGCIQLLSLALKLSPRQPHGTTNRRGLKS